MSDERFAPPPRSLGHGIHVIPAPLPFPSPKAVNVYSIESDDGITLLDCGVDWEPGREALWGGLAALGLARRPVRGLIVSHLHPDHVGMAPRVTVELDCSLIMHRKSLDLYSRYNDSEGFARRTLDLGRVHGVPTHALVAFADVGRRPDYMPPIGPPDEVVEDGDEIDLGAGRTLTVVHTPGHEQAHICLRDSRTGILFSGDHVLPRITPVIMFDEDVDDVLGDYLRSLGKLIDLEIGLTYPAHGTIIERGTDRAEQIVLHHDRRLSGMADVVRLGPTTAWRVMERVYRPHLEPVEQRLALRETVSHLEHLRLCGRLTSFEEDGVIWYRRP